MINVRNLSMGLTALLSPQLRRAAEATAATGLFDSAWYLEQYPDIAGVEPLLHYVRFGEAEGRSPNALFDPIYYRSQTEIPPEETALSHFVETGWKQGIAPHPLFDMTYYRERYPDVSGNPLVHFLQHGEGQGYDPHPLFLTTWYLARVGQPVERPVVHFLRHGAVSPYPLFDPAYYGDTLVHYLTTGAGQGRDPHPLFSTRFYSRLYRTMLHGMNPLVHYAKVGGVLPHQPHALFDPAYYRTQRPDAARTGYPMLIAYVESAGDESPHPLFDPAFYRQQAGQLTEPPLVHYIRTGDREGLWPNRMFDTGFYAARHPERRGMTALEHYVEHCFEVDSDPHPSLSTVEYMNRGPIRAPGQTPLEHYLTNGACSGRMLAGAEGLSIEEVQRAFDEAREGKRDLLLTVPGVSVTPEAAEALRDVLRLDPYFGAAVPRFSYNGMIRSLDGSEHLPAGVLERTAEYYIVPEIVSPCWLIRREVVQNAPPLDRSFCTASGAIFDLLYRMRRRGYRCVVANRAVVPMQSPVTETLANLADIHRLSIEQPDNLRARQEFGRDPAHRHERLQAEHRTLLLDGRGIPAGFNGTSEFALGLLDGIEASEHDWRITLLVNPGVDEFHSLSRRYPRLRVTTAKQGSFAAALTLSTVWYPDTVRHLHDLALFNAYFVYDTIAWDAIYPAPENLNRTWSFLAERADALLYLSDFTRRRFRMRFPAAVSVRDHVCYPSLDAADYAKAPAADGDYLLIAGNEYDHKGVAECAEALRAAFPALPIRVTGQAKGAEPQAAIDEMYARARVVVFPSFYEGFGFPMIRGLAYGKTVFVRDSELVRELLALWAGPGGAVTFESTSDLIAAVRSEGAPKLTGQGTGAPPNWNTAAQSLLDFLERVTAEPSRWLARESAFRQMAGWSQ